MQMRAQDFRFLGLGFSKFKLRNESKVESSGHRIAM